MLTAPSVRLHVRSAAVEDLDAIRRIFNEGIEDRIATLDASPKSIEEIAAWWSEHGGRYAVLVAEDTSGRIAGWASLTPYSHRCAYSGVADLSVYVAREARHTGVGSSLLGALEKRAKENAFHKLVLFTLSFNDAGRSLYAKFGYREVGTFKEQGQLAGRFVDVIAMEKLLKTFVLFVCKHNTGRSQMAEAFFRQFVGDRADVASAGTVAADRPDPGVVAAMAELGFDLSHARPKLLDPILIDRADRIITMGCDVEGVPRIDADWGLPNPKGQTPERIAEIRDIVRKKAAALAEELLGPIA